LVQIFVQILSSYQLADERHHVAVVIKNLLIRLM